jgi:N-acetylmuramoyl-L-alanine amidase
MKIKHKSAVFFTMLIITLIMYILYWGKTRPISVVLQAGHEGRILGNTGASSKLYREKEWTVLVANKVAYYLRQWKIEVKRVPAKLEILRADLAISIHFDGAKVSCSSGASIGYPNENSYGFAQDWKALYKNYFPYRWHRDNFTKNLEYYYAYKWIRANKFLVLELGEITCAKQTRWLKPRLDKIAHLLAYAIATELGVEVKKPSLLLP